LAVFNRPNAYISLRWYVSSPAVATWNYAVVHVHGRLSILGSSELDQVLMTIVHQYEPDLIGNSSLMPQSHLDKLKSAIVGFGTSIESIQAKFKLGQKRSSADQMGVYVYLFRSTNLDDQQLSLFLKNTLKFN
jgi:transcriptional regulator